MLGGVWRKRRLYLEYTGDTLAADTLLSGWGAFVSRLLLSAPDGEWRRELRDERQPVGIHLSASGNNELFHLGPQIYFIPTE